MSVQAIRAIIERHTGPHANDQPIPHADVEAMITAARDGTISMAERLELLSAVEMFGPNILRPKGQLSPEDLKLLGATIMDGIETPDAFLQIGPIDQAKFLVAMAYSEGDILGVTAVKAADNDEAESLRADLEALSTHVLSLAERRIEGATLSNSLTTIAYRGRPFGFIFTCSAQIADAQAVWYSARYYLNPSGHVLKHEGGWEAPDPPDPS